MYLALPLLTKASRVSQLEIYCSRNYIMHPVYIYIYIVVGLLFCLRNDAYERQSIPFFLVLNLYSWGSKRYQLLKSNIYKRRYACKKINMIFICKFIILLSDFRIKLLKNKRKHKKKRRKWKNGH